MVVRVPADRRGVLPRLPDAGGGLQGLGGALRAPPPDAAGRLAGRREGSAGGRADPVGVGYRADETGRQICPSGGRRAGIAVVRRIDWDPDLVMQMLITRSRGLCEG